MMRHVIFIFGLLLVGFTILLQLTQDKLINDSMSLAFYDTDTRGNHILSRIDLTGKRTRLMQTSVDRPMLRFAWSRNGQRILVTVRNEKDGSGDVYLVHWSGNSIQHIYHTPYLAVGAQYSPDKSEIALIRRGDNNNYQWGYLIRLDEQGHELGRYRIGSDKGSDRYWELEWLDNTSLQVTTSPFISAYEIDTTTDTITSIDNTALNLPEGPQYSPNGQWELDTHFSGGTMGLERKDWPINSNPVRIAEFEGLQMSYIWSSDSQWILVSVIQPLTGTSPHVDPSEYFILDFKGEHLQRLKDNTEYKGWLPFSYKTHTRTMQHRPSPFSKNNEWVAYVAIDDDVVGTPTNPDIIDAELRVIRTDGSGYEIKNLARGKILSAHLEWAPTLSLTQLSAPRLYGLGVACLGVSFGLAIWRRKRQN